MNKPSPQTSNRFLVVGEFVLIVLLFFVYAGHPPPNVNESHYLTRTKHFWNPAWCEGDLFLSSREAHSVFQITFGWLSMFLSLPALAWAGRLLGWCGLAAGWMRLSRSVLGHQRGWHLLSAAIALVLWDRAHLAGEWVVGGIEAKVPAYVIVFFGLAELVRGRWHVAVPLLGLATSFHPLVGGWSLIAAAVAWLLDADRPPLKSLVAPVLLAVLLASPGLVAALRLDWGTEAETIRGAHRTYVFRRLGHHLLVLQFAWQNVARHLLLAGVWLAAWQGIRRLPELEKSRWDAANDRLQKFVCGCVVIALAGAMIEVVTHRNPFICSSWMRFYWYRMTDSMLPIGCSFAIAGLAAAYWKTRPRVARATVAVALLLVLVSMTFTFLEHRQDRRPAADAQGRTVDLSAADRRQDYLDWRETCDWCQKNTATGDLFLTPTYNQTFKWYASRPEFATWKDIPQDSQSIAEWGLRRKDIAKLNLHRIGSKPSTDEIVDWARQREIQFIILARRFADPAWKLPSLFENGSYRVYRVPHEQS